MILKYYNFKPKSSIKVRATFFVGGKIKTEMEVENMFYIKPNLKNMSQGARLEYIREVRHMIKEDVAAYFGFGGKEPNKTIREYENNTY